MKHPFLEIARLQQKIQKDVAAQFTDAQRRAFLREQIRSIQKELGEDTEGGPEQQVAQLRERLESAKPPPEVLAQANRELKRLAQLHPASAEFPLIVGYVESLAELPWSKLTPDNLDLQRAQEVFDRDHYVPPALRGLKEKSLAAPRAEVTTVIIPKLNEKDLVDVPAEVKDKLEFVLAKKVDDVLAAALEVPVGAPNEV